MASYDVVALGELLIDFAHQSVNESGYPVLSANPGGAPGNFLAALAKYGCKTAMIGKELGLKVFDMGGGKPGGKIEEFKRNFISDDGVWAYYATKKIWNEEVYKVLLERKETINNPGMFPLYRG